MPNIQYEIRLQEIGTAFAANNLVLYQELIDGFNADFLKPQFNEEEDLLTGSERELFEYVSGYDGIYQEAYATEYVAPQAGLPTNVYPINPADPNSASLFAYVGVYANEEGDFSGEVSDIEGNFINGPPDTPVLQPEIIPELPDVLELISPVFTVPITNPDSVISPPAKTFKDCL
jgi:hypothetical protein